MHINEWVLTTSQLVLTAVELLRESEHAAGPLPYESFHTLVELLIVSRELTKIHRKEGDLEQSLTVIQESAIKAWDFYCEAVLGVGLTDRFVQAEELATIPVLEDLRKHSQTVPDDFVWGA